MILKKTICQLEDKEKYSVTLLKNKKTTKELQNAVEFGNLIYHYKCLTKGVDFSNYDIAKS